MAYTDTCGLATSCLTPFLSKHPHSAYHHYYLALATHFLVLSIYHYLPLCSPPHFITLSIFSASDTLFSPHDYFIILSFLSLT